MRKILAVMMSCMMAFTSLPVGILAEEEPVQTETTEETAEPDTSAETEQQDKPEETAQPDITEETEQEDTTDVKGNNESVIEEEEQESEITEEPEEPEVPEVQTEEEQAEAEYTESDAPADESESNDSEEDEPVAEEEYEEETYDANATDPSNFTYTVTDGKVTITKYVGSLSEVVIPSKIDGSPVTVIGNKAFYGNTGLTSITIPSSVTTIKESAFEKCSKLVELHITSIKGWLNTTIEGYAHPFISSGGKLFIGDQEVNKLNIPDGVTKIPFAAFYKCKNITSAVIPDSVESIGKSAFLECSELTKVTIGDGVTTIGAYAFESCVKLSSINIPANVTSIYTEIFYDCQSLKTAGPTGSGSNIEFAWSDTIPANAFDGNKYLTSVTIPDSITTIGEKAFNGCSSLVELHIESLEGWLDTNIQTSGFPFVGSSGGKLFIGDQEATDLVIPDGVTRIPFAAFYKCKNITSVLIPDSVTSIGKSAFIECSELKAVSIGDGVTSIDAYAFDSCTKLSQINIPASVTSMNAEVFYNCPNLKTAGPSGSGSNIELGCKESIPTHAFNGCKNLSKVIIPDGVTAIGRSAFSNCSALVSVTIPASVSSIADSAFYNCTNVRELHVESIEGWLNTELADKSSHPLNSSTKGKLYVGTSEIDYVNIPDNISGLKNYALLNCTNIKKIRIPDNAFSIGTEALTGTNLSAVEVEDNNQHFCVKDGVLYSKDMKQLILYPAKLAGADYFIPDSVTEIKAEAFYRQYYTLLHLHVPASVTSIGGFEATGVAMVGEKGIYAETYAKENRITFLTPEELMTGNQDVNGRKDSKLYEDSYEEIIPQGNTYMIENASQLAWLSQQVNKGYSFAGKQVILTCDIDLADIEWQPIGTYYYSFAGNFDGDGHTIRNLNVSENNDSGLFGVISNLKSTTNIKICDLTIENVFVDGNSQYSGALAGRIESYAERSFVEVSNIRIISTKQWINGKYSGGLAGSCSALNNGTVTISDCTVDGKVYSGTGGTVGGLFGYTYSTNNGKITIRDAVIEGRIEGYARRGADVYCGGVVGNTENSQTYFERCLCINGTISASGIGQCEGGITGKLSWASRITSCLNYMDVLGTGYANGGIAGTNNGTIKECYNEGAVESTTGGSYGYGGITGKNDGVILDCYSMGHVPDAGSSLSYAGGITSQNGGTIENCYVLGDLKDSFNSVAASGASMIGCLPGGTTKYCYFDSDIASQDNLYHGIKAETIIDDPSHNITHSGGLTTSQMMDESSYMNWDFNTVWEFDDLYSLGYPTLSSIKDLMMMNPAEDRTSGDKGLIKVIDQDGKPIEDAEVTYNNETKKTGRKGEISVQYTDSKTVLTVKKEGYKTYEYKDFLFGNIHEFTVRLIDMNKLRENPLLSCLLTINTRTGRFYKYELLTEQITVNLEDGMTTNLTFEVKPADETKNYKSYILLQGEKVIAHSDTPTITVDKNQLITTIKSNESEDSENENNNTYIKMLDINGDEYVQKINLYTTRAEEIETELEIGDGLEFTFDQEGDNSSIFSGLTVKLPTTKLPFKISISESKARFMLNIGKEYSYDEKEMQYMGEAFEYGKNEMGKSIAKMIKAATDKSFTASTSSQDVKVTWKIVGIGETDLPLDFDNSIRLQMGILLEISGKYEHQLPYFIVIGLMPELSVSPVRKVTLKLKKGSLGYFCAVGETEQFDIDGSLKIGVAGGIGIRNCFMVGLYGDPTAAISYRMFPKSDSGMKDLYAEGSISCVLRIAGSNVLSQHVGNVDRIWIYKDGKYVLDQPGSQKQSLQSMAKEATYHAASPSEEPAASKWQGNNSILQETSYSASSPILMNTNDNIVMLFTSNTITGRSSADASVLMYSVYNKEKNSFSDPKPVDDDGTADFNPKVSGRYVLWHDSKSSLDGCGDIKDVTKKQELTVAKFDPQTQTFTDVTTVTDNDKYEIDPEISDGSAPIITWTENSDDDIFGYNGSNTEYMAALSHGGWTVTKMKDSSEMVYITKSGMIDGIPFKVSGLMDDEDNTSILIENLSSGETYTIDDETLQNIMFAGNNVFVQLNDGSLGRISIHGEMTEENIPESLMYYTFRNVIQEENGSITAVLTKNGDNLSDLYIISYDAVLNRWSAIQKLTASQKTNYVEGAAIAKVNNKYVIVYNQRMVNVGTEDLNGKNSLRFTTIDTTQPVFSGTRVRFERDNVKAGTSLPLVLFTNNTGHKESRKAVIKVTCKQNNKTVTVYNETAEINLLEGETLEYPFSIDLPENMTETTYTAEITDVETSVKSNCTFTVGGANFKLDKKVYDHNGIHELLISIDNIGYGNGDAMLELFDYDDENVVLERYKARNLNSEDVIYYRTRLDNLDWTEYNNKKIGIRIIKNGQIEDSTTVPIYKHSTPKLKRLSIDKETYKLLIDETVQLTVTSDPSDADISELMWASDDESIAVVDENGLVTAKGMGSTKIRAFMPDSDHYVACYVTVSHVHSLIKTEAKPATVSEEGNTEYWTCSECGKYFSDENGENEIKEGSWIIPKIVKVDPKSIVINEGEKLEIATLEEQSLTVSVLPEEANDEVVWTSSNEKAAVVDENGVVTAKTYGKTTITAASAVKPGVKDTIQIQTRFYDVNDSTQSYYKPVYWGADNGVVAGYDGGVYFGPDNVCTRAQFVTFLWRLAGKPEGKKAVNFKDISTSVNYYRAVKWAVSEGIIVGYKDDNTFRPDNEVTRGQVAVMLWRFAGKKTPTLPKTSPFSDIDASNSSYRAVVWGQQAGVIKGYKTGEYAGQFRPDASCLRQHIVTFLYRYARDVMGKDVSGN